MKKLESSLANMVIVLTVISVVAGGILAYVNQITAGPIEKIKAETLNNALRSVLNADEMPQVSSTNSIDEFTTVYVTNMGVAVQAATDGFGGKLKVLVGFTEDGAISGYSVLEHAETPGLGAKAGEWFQKGAKGDIIGKKPAEKALAVSKDGGEVDAITASTITSRAFLQAVNQAYQAYSGTSMDAASSATPKASAQAGCCQEGKCKEGQCQEGKCKEGQCQEGKCKEGTCRNGACKEGACQQASCKNACQQAEAPITCGSSEACGRAKTTENN